MKTLHSERDRAEIADRLNRLSPGQEARWGKMNAPQMVVHLADALRMATGDLAVRGKDTFLRYPPVKKLIIYVLPFPKGAPTARELQSRVPTSWGREMADLQALITGFAAHANRSEWPNHPVFGRMSREDWGALAYKHSDHHLKQFGA